MSESTADNMSGSTADAGAAGPGHAGQPGAGQFGLSAAAAKRITVMLENEPDGSFFRVAVNGGGCSGFQYRFELADAPEDEDLSSETDGVRLIIDPISLDLVAGSTVDFVESLGGAAFRVENPQAAAGCGCGSSFGI